MPEIKINTSQAGLLINNDLAEQYKKATDQLIQDFAAEITSVKSTAFSSTLAIFINKINININENDDCEILYSPEVWSKKRRFGQTEITIDKEQTLSRFKKMEWYFLAYYQAVEFESGDEKKKKLIKIIQKYEAFYQEMLARYSWDFLQQAQEKLKGDIAELNAFDINKTVEGNDTQITTASQAITKHDQLKTLIADQSHENTPLYLAVSELILDEYYFNPVSMDNTEVFWMSIKIISMVIAALCALGALLCMILTPFFPPAAFAGFVLGKIALAGLIPVAIDIKDYIRLRWNQRAASSRSADVIGGMAIPAIMVPIILTVTVITSKVLAPFLAVTEMGLVVAEYLGYIGGYGLNTIGTFLNTFFGTQTSSSMKARAYTPQNADQVSGHTVVSLEQGVRIINQERTIDNWHETSDFEKKEASKSTESRLCFLYQTAEGYKSKESNLANLRASKSLVLFSSPNQSELYQQVEKSFKAYNACTANESIESRLEKIETLIQDCTKWINTRGSASKRKARVGAILSSAQVEKGYLTEIPNLSQQNSLSNPKAPPLLLCMKPG